MNCTSCNDTGSLSKELDGQLDCAHCGVADERVMVEVWSRQHAPDCDSFDAWLIYQHGKAAAAPP
jgi:hypothetical protein